jgi:hypothetical protein
MTIDRRLFPRIVLNLHFALDDAWIRAVCTFGRYTPKSLLQIRAN